MRNFDTRLEKPLEHFNISLEMANKLAKKIVYRHTLIDGEGYLNVCVKDKNNCRRTYIHIDKDFLVNSLNYNWAKLGLSGGLYDGFRDVLEDVWGFDVDFSIFITTNFIFPEIYDVYFKPLETDYIIESMNRKNKNKLTKEQTVHLISLYEDMGYDRESAIDELKDLVSYINNLSSPLTLYRIICSDSEEEINLSKVGSHYSLNKKNLTTNHYRRGSVAGDCRGEKVFLLTVSADKSMINVMETLSNNILYPHEEEITLKGEGYGVNVIKVEEL